MSCVMYMFVYLSFNSLSPCLISSSYSSLSSLSHYHYTATHFRFGTISWRIPDASQPTTVEFFSSFAFRRSFFGKPNVGSTINPGTFGFGDGSASVQLLLQISSIDLVNDWAAGTFTTTYTYPAGVSKNYTAIHTSAVCSPPSLLFSLLPILFSPLSPFSLPSKKWWPY